MTDAWQKQVGSGFPFIPGTTLNAKRKTWLYSTLHSTDCARYNVDKKGQNLTALTCLNKQHDSH